MIVLEWLESFNDFLNQSIAFRGFKFLLGFYLVIMLAAIGLILYRLVKLGYFTVLQTGQEFPITKGKMDKRWEDVQEIMAKGDASSQKAAVLEAGNMLFETLDTIGYEGETLTEKLDNLEPPQLEHLDELREAAKIRAHIVQDKDFEISKEEARQTVETFVEALKSIEAID